MSYKENQALFKQHAMVSWLCVETEYVDEQLLILKVKV